jgi:hypothetical protein
MEGIMTMVGDQPTSRDVLIVPANQWAYDCFWRYSAYICQAGRHFRSDVHRLGYYANGAIQREFPAILVRRDHVALTEQTVARLHSTGAWQDAAFATVVERLIADGHHDRAEQIFLVSGPHDRWTWHIANPICNSERTASGRRTAWARGHRYVPEDALLTDPQTTSDLSEWRVGE